MNPKTQPPTSKLAVWMLAARPKTLPAAAAPVIVGAAVAWHDGVFSLLPALAALLGALLLQIGANFANDVYDFKKGADAGERLGPVRVTQSGLLSPKEVETGMWLTFALATLVGVYLLIVGGWVVAAIGLASIIAAIAYTGGPYPLGYNGLGDIFVFIFFGLAAVVGTYYVQAHTASTTVWWAAVPMGLLATNILVVNNLRDIESDRAAGKRTLAVRLGKDGARLQYVILLVVSYSIPTLMIPLGLAPSTVMLTWLSLPLIKNLWRDIFHAEGRALNATLAATAQLELVYALLFALGMVLG